MATRDRTSQKASPVAPQTLPTSCGSRANSSVERALWHKFSVMASPVASIRHRSSSGGEATVSRWRWHSATGANVRRLLHPRSLRYDRLVAGEKQNCRIKAAITQQPGPISFRDIFPQDQDLGCRVFCAAKRIEAPEAGEALISLLHSTEIFLSQ
jgi:hypothetical protein